MGRDASEIAMRDPALAALMGVMGSDFGNESSGYAADAYEVDQFEGEDSFGASGFGEDGDDGDDEMGLESIFGMDAPAAPGGHGLPIGHPAHPMYHPNPAVRKILQHHMRRHSHRDQRLALLEPNKYSELKVERYTFSLSALITALGPGGIGGLSGNNSPDVNFRPQRVTSNAVSPAFVLISDARVANVSFTVGGLIDSWQWNANAVGQSLDVPTLTPANKASFSGQYTGLVPMPLSGTGAYTFILSFSGPASIVA
jgi:hypothetical protein